MDWLHSVVGSASSSIVQLPVRMTPWDMKCLDKPTRKGPIEARKQLRNGRMEDRDYRQSEKRFSTRMKPRSGSSGSKRGYRWSISPWCPTSGQSIVGKNWLLSASRLQYARPCAHALLMRAFSLGLSSFSCYAIADMSRKAILPLNIPLTTSYPGTSFRFSTPRTLHNDVNPTSHAYRSLNSSIILSQSFLRMLGSLSISITLILNNNEHTHYVVDSGLTMGTRRVKSSACPLAGDLILGPLAFFRDEQWSSTSVLSYRPAS